MEISNYPVGIGTSWISAAPSVSLYPPSLYDSSDPPVGLDGGGPIKRERGEISKLSVSFLIQEVCDRPEPQSREGSVGGQ